MKPNRFVEQCNSAASFPRVLGEVAIFVLAACLVFAATVQSKGYSDSLAQKHALLSSIHEDVTGLESGFVAGHNIVINGEDLSKMMPTAGMPNTIGAVSMYGTLTPEKNHDIIKERKE